MLFKPKHITVGHKIARFTALRVLELKSFRVGVSALGFQFVQITYLRPPWNSLAQVHAVWYATCWCRPKIGQICYNLGFEGLWVLGYGFVLAQMTKLRQPLNSPVQVYDFWYPTCHSKPKIGQICCILGI